MKLLAISYVLPPNQYPQAIQVGRLLYGTSAAVTAVCGTVQALARGLDCYPDFEYRLSARIEVPFSPRFTGIAHKLAYYLLPLYAKAPDEFRAWVPRAERAVLEFFRDRSVDCDALVSFGQPMSDHLLALRLKRKLKLPWIAHFSDPWVDNPFRRQSFVSKAMNARMEADVIATADRLIFTSAETVDTVMRKYPASWRDKVSILPHGYEPRLYPEVQRRDGPILVRHLGSFYGRRSPEPLFRGLRALLGRDPHALENVRVELVGETPTRFMRTEAFRSLPAGLVSRVGNVDYSRSLHMMAEADLLLVIDAPARISIFLPSKLVDYIGSGRPVFGIVPRGTSARLIERLGGEAAEPDDTQAIADGIARAIESARQRRRANDDMPWGDAAVRAQFRAENVVAQFDDTIARVLE